MIFKQQDIQESINKLDKKQSSYFSEDMCIKFTHYLNGLLQWNKTYNLTAITEKNAVLTRHLLDSLLLVPYFTNNQAHIHKSVIDVGSGAGLPGLLLAIACPNLSFHLLDSANKRTRFMRQMVLELDLKNITIIHARAQDFKPEIGFDYVLSRAFANLSDMIHWCSHLLKQDTHNTAQYTGRFLAMKGHYDLAEIAALPKHIKIESTHALLIPDLEIEARHLIILSISND